MSIPVILDCDPGHDDAIALLLALASPELDLLGVTTVHGNQTLEKTTANALRVLDLADRPDVPVAAGADRPLVRELTVASHVHGDSGLDGPTLPPTGRAPLGEHAVDFMERTIAASPVPVTLVPTGPLTNIALLLERTGGANVERIVSMGGAVAEGNMTPAAEFNIWADPEAAQAVFHAGVDIDDDRARRHAPGRHDGRAPGTAARGGHDRRVRRRPRRLLRRLPPRDVRLGRRADPRCRRGRARDPARARDDDRQQRRDRAGVRPLPRSHGGRPLAADRDGRSTPTSASTSTPTPSSTCSSSGSAGSADGGRRRLRRGAVRLAEQVRARPGARRDRPRPAALHVDELPGRLRLHRGHDGGGRGSARRARARR